MDLFEGYEKYVKPEEPAKVEEDNDELFKVEDKQEVVEEKQEVKETIPQFNKEALVEEITNKILEAINKKEETDNGNS